MHPKLNEIADYLDKTRADLRAAIDEVPARYATRRPAEDRWSVAEIVEHLSIIETRICDLVEAWLVKARAEGVGPDPDTSSVVDPAAIRLFLNRDFKVQARETSLPAGGLDLDQAYAALAKARARTHQLLQAADGIDVGKAQHPHPVLGSLNGYQWLGFIGAHEARHTLQVRENVEVLQRADGTVSFPQS